MAGIDLTSAQAHLDAWLAADLALAKSQSYTITVNGSSRQLTRADAIEVRNNVEHWDARVKRMTPRTKSRTRYAVLG